MVFNYNILNLSPLTIPVMWITTLLIAYVIRCHVAKRRKRNQQTMSYCGWLKEFLKCYWKKHDIIVEYSTTALALKILHKFTDTQSYHIQRISPSQLASLHLLNCSDNCLLDHPATQNLSIWCTLSFHTLMITNV